MDRTSPVGDAVSHRRADTSMQDALLPVGKLTELVAGGCVAVVQR
jgi:hypothetical protein